MLPRGFEPPAHSLGNYRSIHLSYGSLFGEHLFAARSDIALEITDILDHDFIMKQFNFSEIRQMCQRFIGVIGGDARPV